MKVLLLSFAYFAAIFQLQAVIPDVNVKYLKMEAITIHDGLSQGMINCIYQDHFGFMWFGTMDGLNRYDGYHFTIYRYDANDSNSLSGNPITSILEDSKGRLWVGTGLNGLNLFDRETEKFMRLQHSAPSNVVIGNFILSIKQDQSGAIWVGTSNGLKKITIHENTTVSRKRNTLNINNIIITHIVLDP